MSDVYESNRIHCPKCGERERVECIDKPGDHHHECHTCGFGEAVDRSVPYMSSWMEQFARRFVGMTVVGVEYVDADRSLRLHLDDQITVRVTAHGVTADLVIEVEAAPVGRRAGTR